MSEYEALFLKKLRNTLWQAVGSIFVIVIVAGIPFYFNTKSGLERHDEIIRSLKEEKADKQVYEISINQINKQLEEIKISIKDLNKTK